MLLEKSSAAQSFRPLTVLPETWRPKGRTSVSSCRSISGRRADEPAEAGGAWGAAGTPPGALGLPI